MSKKKILVVVNSLWQAGGEKYAYELVNELDSSFHCEILTSITQQRVNDDSFYNYYQDCYRKKGIRIHTFLNDKFFEVKIRYHFIKKLIDSFLFRTKLEQVLVRNFQKKRELFFSKFDSIIIIDASVYRKISHWITDIHSYIEIHLINHKIQFEYNVYEIFEEPKKFNFVFIDKKQIDELKESNVDTQNSYFFPLSIDTTELEFHERTYEKNGLVKIGIFTRISRDKPLEKFLYAFEKVVKIEKNSRLVIFGKILDVIYYQEILKIIEKLELEEFILFKGHSNNILESTVDECIDIIWNFSIYSFIGYATLELISSGAVIICNNVYNDDNYKSDNIDVIPPYFYNYENLADYSVSIINEKKYKEISFIQFLYLTGYHDIKKNIIDYRRHLFSKISK